MKSERFATAFVQGIWLLFVFAQGAWAADNQACINMAKEFFGPTDSGSLIAAHMDLSCSDSKGNQVCISHDKEAVRMHGTWSGGAFSYLTLFHYPSDSPELAAQRAREPYTIVTTKGHRVSSTATTLLTFGAQTSNYGFDYQFTVKVNRDFSGASLKIKETKLLGSTLTNETLTCQRLAPNWRPTGWPTLLSETTRADGVKFKVGDVVTASVKAQPDYWYRDRRYGFGELAPGRIERIYDNHKDGVKFAIVGAGRPRPAFYTLKDYEPTGPVDLRGGGMAQENERYKWTEASELKLLASGSIEPLFRAGILPATETLDISIDTDCYLMGSEPANHTLGHTILRFELGGGNLRETRMGAGMLEKSAAKKALVSEWLAAQDHGADLHYLIRQVRIPGLQGRAWAVARERQGASSPERYWLCPADAR